jgi:hypothetical protein
MNIPYKQDFLSIQSPQLPVQLLAEFSFENLQFIPQHFKKYRLFILETSGYYAILICKYSSQLRLNNLIFKEWEDDGIFGHTFTLVRQVKTWVNQKEMNLWMTAPHTVCSEAHYHFVRTTHTQCSFPPFSSKFVT